MTGGPTLRIVLFGMGGWLSAASLKALAAEHEVIAVVRAMRSSWAKQLAGRVARRLGLRAEDPVDTAARAARVAQWPVASMRDPRLAARIAAAKPDLICVSQFPWRVPEPVLAAAGLGGINLHPSLLPRHRGPLPHFWVYHANDREAGVTVHHMTTEFDNGDVIGQRSFPLARGFPVDELNATNARLGSALLCETVRDLARGTTTRQAQDATRATRAPMVKRGSRMVDFEAWDVERVWHFLAGLWPRFVEPLTDTEGRAMAYGGVLGYETRGAAAASGGGPLGTVRPLDADRLALQCQDGVVLLRARVVTPRTSSR